MNAVTFTYRNHRGEQEVRNVIPESIQFLKNPGFGYQPGWFLTGIDTDRNSPRSFRLSHIVLPDLKEAMGYSLFLGS